MRIVIIADSFQPLKNSAAVLVYSLAEAIANMGHHLIVIIPSENIEHPYAEEDYGNFKLLRIRCGQIKSNNLLFRGLNEFSLFFGLPHKFKKTAYATSQWDLVIWYSPSIFLSGLVREIKKRSKSSYLILRDIVPDWLVDVGLIKKGLTYFLLKYFEKYQYQQADIIGVQTISNKHYIEKFLLSNLKRLEVLPNWMPSISSKNLFLEDNLSCINLQHTVLAHKKILIYAGNLGEAQGIENFAQLILHEKDNINIGFLIIGRGSKKEWLQHHLKDNQIQNVLILDEVDLITLSMYYRQCSAGLVFLDLNHRSHNIPGKFISYLEANLPVIALVNPENDLICIIQKNKLGMASDNLLHLLRGLNQFIKTNNKDGISKINSRKFYEENYQPISIAKQILQSFHSIS